MTHGNEVQHVLCTLASETEIMCPQEPYRDHYHRFSLLLLHLSDSLQFWCCLFSTSVTQVMDIHSFQGATKLRHYSLWYFFFWECTSLCFLWLYCTVFMPANTSSAIQINAMLLHHLPFKVFLDPLPFLPSWLIPRFVAVYFSAETPSSTFLPSFPPSSSSCLSSVLLPNVHLLSLLVSLPYK